MEKFEKMIDDMEQFFNPKEGYCCHGWLIIRPDALTLIEGVRKLQQELKSREQQSR